MKIRYLLIIGSSLLLPTIATATIVGNNNVMELNNRKNSGALYRPKTGDFNSTIILKPRTKIIINTVTKERIVNHYVPINQHPDAIIKKLTFSSTVEMGKGGYSGKSYRETYMTGKDSTIELKEVYRIKRVSGHQGEITRYSVEWDPNQGKFLDQGGTWTASGFRIDGGGGKFVLNHKDGSVAAITVNSKADGQKHRVFTYDNGKNLKIIKDTNILNLCFFYKNKNLGCIDYSMTYKVP